MKKKMFASLLVLPLAAFSSVNEPAKSYSCSSVATIYEKQNATVIAEKFSEHFGESRAVTVHHSVFGNRYTIALSLNFGSGAGRANAYRLENEQNWKVLDDSSFGSFDENLPSRFKIFLNRVIIQEGVDWKSVDFQIECQANY